VKKLLADQQSAWAAQGRDVNVQHYVTDEWALLAVQGPSAAKALQPLVDVDLSQLRFMSATLASIDNTPRFVKF
jgi:glycine cleavage system aminomethyltransferase T